MNDSISQILKCNYRILQDVFLRFCPMYFYSQSQLVVVRWVGGGGCNVSKTGGAELTVFIFCSLCFSFFTFQLSFLTTRYFGCDILWELLVNSELKQSHAFIQNVCFIARLLQLLYLREVALHNTTLLYMVGLQFNTEADNEMSKRDNRLLTAVRLFSHRSSHYVTLHELRYHEMTSHYMISLYPFLSVLAFHLIFFRHLP